MARSARCDVRREPPSSSNPTKRLCRRISPVLDAFRQLLLQIGGANIAGADRACQLPSSSSLGDEKHVPSLRAFCSLRSLRLSTAARDPVLIAPLACARSIEWLAQLAAIFAGSRRLRRIRRNDCVAESGPFSTRFVSFSCRSAARTSRARIALAGRRIVGVHCSGVGGSRLIGDRLAPCA
jgi:hypothetical protein